MSLLRDVITNLFKATKGFRGAMQVVLLSLGFWQGRQFRMYREFTLTAGQVVTLRWVASKPFLLQAQSLILVGGDARAVIITGGTPAGTFTPITTLNPKYRIGMEPVSTVVVSAGGTVSGGTEREVLLCAASTGGATKSALGSTRLDSTRGLPASTFYITITAGANGATGLYSTEHEDLD
jgi:hypothetical protein